MILEDIECLVFKALHVFSPVWVTSCSKVVIDEIKMMDKACIEDVYRFRTKEGSKIDVRTDII